MNKALLIGLLLFGMNTQANSEINLLELKKKAAYYEIKVKLEAGEVTLKEAQRLWKKQITKLYKQGGE
jgi:hypothetical protein